MRWKFGVLGVGAGAGLASMLASTHDARSATNQVWPAFVLVAGLLLVGLVAATDGLFAWFGTGLDRAATDHRALVAWVAVIVVVTTALLNLDTSVAFLSPVLVHTSRRRGRPDAGLLAMCILLSNAGSLLLPGSNLTNLIVVGDHTGGTLVLARMALPWVVAAVLTTVVAVALFRHELVGPGETDGDLHQVADRERLAGPVGPVAAVAVVVAIVAFRNPAPVVVGVGMAAALWKLGRGEISPRRILATVDVPVLVGLFGIAVALGTLGRSWSGPSDLMAHLDPWATAAGAALVSVLVNNLPAASILSARPPVHPWALLVGLDVGPNLFCSGSLAWVLWYTAAHNAGGQPDVRRTIRAGLVAAPLAGAAAVGVLVLSGHT